MYLYVFMYIHMQHSTTYRRLSKQTLLFREPSPCSPAAETALQPLMWCSESLFSQGYSSPEGVFSDTSKTAWSSAAWSSAARHKTMRILNTCWFMCLLYSLLLLLFNYICCIIWLYSVKLEYCDCCPCPRLNNYMYVCIYIYTHYIYIYIYIYICFSLARASARRRLRADLPTSVVDDTYLLCISPTYCVYFLCIPIVYTYAYIL